jgi:hypothetical protein
VRVCVCVCVCVCCWLAGCAGSLLFSYSHSHTGTVYAAPGNELLQFVYRTYSQADYVQFIHDYMNLTSPPDWALHDFGKPGDNVSQHAFFSTELLELWTKNARAFSFLLKLAIEGDAHARCVCALA